MVIAGRNQAESPILINGQEAILMTKPEQAVLAPDDNLHPITAHGIGIVLIIEILFITGRLPGLGIKASQTTLRDAGGLLQPEPQDPRLIFIAAISFGSSTVNRGCSKNVDRIIVVLPDVGR